MADADAAGKRPAPADDAPRKKKSRWVDSKGRAFTVSVAVPGSVIANAQTRELQTYLAGQIARALTVYCVDEVIVFDETPTLGRPQQRWDPNVFLARLLQYLETPQYLRKAFFPMHKDLQFAGLLNPLDAPHHMRQEVWSPYREGVTIEEGPDGRRRETSADGTMVNVGLRRPVRLPLSLEPNLRLTVYMGEKPPKDEKRGQTVKAVPPSEPREKRGLYWGYTTRMATGLSGVFADCPYQGGYDLLIGTSHRGTSLQDPQAREIIGRPFKHALLVFGGVRGLEAAADDDDKLSPEITEDVAKLFDVYVNVCPGQGSGTIRTEEAMLVTFAALQPLWSHPKAQQPPMAR